MLKLISQLLSILHNYLHSSKCHSVITSQVVKSVEAKKLQKTIWKTIEPKKLNDVFTISLVDKFDTPHDDHLYIISSASHSTVT